MRTRYFFTLVFVAVAALWSVSALAANPKWTNPKTLRATALYNARALFGHLGKVTVKKLPVYTAPDSTATSADHVYQVLVNGKPIRQGIRESGWLRSRNWRDPQKKLKRPVWEISFRGVWSLGQVVPGKSKTVRVDPYAGLLEEHQRGQFLVVVSPSNAEVTSVKNGEIVGTSSPKKGLKSTAIMPLAPRTESPFSVRAVVTAPDGAKARMVARYRNPYGHWLKSK